MGARELGLFVRLDRGTQFSARGFHRGIVRSE
jgi:hypothetical protein